MAGKTVIEYDKGAAGEAMRGIWREIRKELWE